MSPTKPTNPAGSPKPARKRTPKAASAGRATVSTRVVPTPQKDWPLRLTAITAAVTLAIDQILKWLVVYQLDLPNRRELDVFDPFLNLRMAWNEGVNFGLLSNGGDYMRWVLIAVALAVCVWVAVWVRQVQLGRFGRIAAGLLIGGALGNVVDRIAYGAVADFLNMSLPGWTNPYSFNVADIAVFAGAIGLVLLPQPDKPRDVADKTR